MSMSVRADDTGLEYAGARGIRGLFASWQSARPRYLRMLGEIIRFHRAASRLLRDGDDGDLETLQAFLNRHGFSRSSSSTSSRRWWPRCGRARRRRAALPGALPVRVSGPPRHAVGVRLADLAHGGRRFGALRAGHRGPAPRSRVGHRVHSLRRVPDGVLIRPAPTRRVFSTPPSSPCTPIKRCTCSTTPHRGSARCWARSLLDQPRPAAHRRVGAAPAPARPRIVELPDRTGHRPGAGHLRRQPADADQRRPSIPGHPWRPGRVDPASVIAEMTYCHPLTHRNPLPPNACCPRSTTIEWCSRAPTTAGASTRTAPPRGCAPPTAGRGLAARPTPTEAMAR